LITLPINHVKVRKEIAFLMWDFKAGMRNPIEILLIFFSHTIAYHACQEDTQN
jgi:hypothetical protein